MKKHWLLILIFILVCGSVYTWIQILKFNPVRTANQYDSAYPEGQMSLWAYSAITALCQQEKGPGKANVTRVTSCNGENDSLVYEVAYDALDMGYDYYDRNFAPIGSCDGELADTGGVGELKEATEACIIVHDCDYNENLCDTANEP